MVEINLKYNNIPREIDIPKKHTPIKYLYAIIIFGVILIILSFIIPRFFTSKIYYTKHINKVAKQKINSSMAKKPISKKIENKKPTNTQKLVFSFDISLMKMKPHIIPVVKKTQAYVANKPITNSKKIKVISVYIIIYNKNNLIKLKSYLKKKDINFKIVNAIIKKEVLYDIFVGGFDDYKTTLEFEKALRSKGYTIYSVKNINLLYYVNIANNISTNVKNLYLSVWKTTPFKIYINKHTKIHYAYKTIFKTDTKEIKILKKIGYFPIIVK